VARIWQTGFETGHYGIFDVQQPGAGSPSTSNTRGSWSAYNSGSLNTSIATIPGNPAELYVGIGVYRHEFSFQFLGFADAGTDQLRFLISASGFLEVRRGDGTVLGTGAILFPDLTWVFLELHFTISDTIGVIDSKINGVTDLALSGKDTKNTANAFVNQITLNTGGGAAMRLDDIVVSDTTTAQNNTWPTDTKLTGLIPNAVGDITQLARFGADSGTNWGQVDDRPPNDATDGVQSSTLNQYDLYNIPDLTGYGSVQAATLWLRAQKDDAGSALIAPMIKSGAVENQAADIALPTSWSYLQKVYNLDPTDSAAWTVAKINALQIGAKVR
jgi:hypothetical protein